MNNENHNADRALARAEALADEVPFDNWQANLERAQAFALISIAESLYTLTKFLIEKEEGTS